MALAIEQKVTKFLNSSLPDTTQATYKQNVTTIKCYSGSYWLF